MLATVYSRTQLGMEAPEITIDVHLSAGLPSWAIVGRPEKSASQYLYLWKQRGLVEALGGHSAALADQLKHAGWAEGLSPDDIEWPEASEADERDWRAACQSLGLPGIALRAMAESPRAHQPRAARH